MSRQRYFLVLICMLFLAGCASSPSVKVYENTEETVNEHDEKQVTAMLTDMNPDEGLMDFVSVEDGSSLHLIYHGGVHIVDSDDREISIDTLHPGSVLHVTYYRDTWKLVKLEPGKHVTQKYNIKKLNTDMTKRTGSFQGISFELSDFARAYNGDEEISFADISTEDEVTLSLIGNTLISAIITKGHGYVRLSNHETYIGGLVEIGKDVIVPVTENMLITVGEGEYTLRINKAGYSGQKTVKVMRDRETSVDLTDIAVPEGTVTFQIEPSDADTRIFVDGNEISGKRYIGAYGEHSFRIEADGFSDVRGKIKIKAQEQKHRIRLHANTTTTEETTQTTEATTETATKTDADKKTTESTGETTQSGETTKTTETTEQSGEKVSSTSTQTDYKIKILRPEGVGVYLDGAYMGVAPVSVPKVEGTHTITLYKEGYLIKSYTIQAVDDGTDDEYSYADLTSVLD